MATPVVWRLAAADPAGLRAHLADLAGSPGAAERSVTVGDGPVRLAVVDPAPRKAKLADRLVGDGEAWGGRSDIWFSPSAQALAGGTVAFLFPGVEPSFGAGGIDLPALAGLLGLAAPDVSEDTVAHRSAAIIRLGIFLDAVLRRLGVTPDLVGGHSIGEWSATVSAGMSAPADAEALITSVDLGAVELPQVDFAAIVAGADEVTAALAGVAGVEVSHDNCSRQSVICGPPDRVAEAMGVLGGRNLLGQVLDFRSGFHTSALLPALPHLRDHIDRFPLQARHTPIWSATTCAPLPDDLTAAREVMTRHLVEPVRFRPMIEAMYEAGARVFVQPGIGNLTGFVDDILGARPHAAVPVVTAKRTAQAQLHRALAALWVDGVESTWPSAAPAPPPAAPPAPATTAPPRVRVPDPSPSDGSRTQSGGPTAVAAPAPVPPSGALAPAPLRARVRVPDPLLSNGSRTRSRERAAVAAPAVAAPAGLDPGAIHPVLAAAAAVVHNASRATEDIVAAWAAAPARPAARLAPAAGRTRGGVAARPAALRPAAPAPLAPAPAPAAPAPPAPAAPPASAPPTTTAGGEPPEGQWPTGRFTITYRASLDRMPYMLDHTLYRQPPGWHDDSDLFPIVAMTTQLWMLEEIARRYAQGRDVIELSDVRNYRWLDISEPVDLEVTIVPEGADTLRIALGPYCRAKVTVGEYPSPTRYEHAPLRAPRPARKTPQQLWDERLMFHGPRFHGIRRLGPVGEDGMWGELEGMPDPGPLLDNVGKLIAYWTMEQVGWGEAPLPIGVAKVQYSGPPPEPGEPVPADMRIESMDDDFVVGEAVLCRADGTTWCHIEGWRMHIFHRDEVMDPMSRWVEKSLAANPEPGGLLLQYERWPGTPTRDLWAHQALRRDERATYESMTPADRRAWLVEVTAVKEAMRHWLRTRHGLDSYPVQVDVARVDGGPPGAGDRWVATSSLAPGGVVAGDPGAGPLAGGGGRRRGVGAGGGRASAWPSGRCRRVPTPRPTPPPWPASCRPGCRGRRCSIASCRPAPRAGTSRGPGRSPGPPPSPTKGSNHERGHVRPGLRRADRRPDRPRGRGVRRGDGGRAGQPVRGRPRARVDGDRRARRAADGPLRGRRRLRGLVRRHGARAAGRPQRRRRRRVHRRLAVGTPAGGRRRRELTCWYGPARSSSTCGGRRPSRARACRPSCACTAS